MADVKNETHVDRTDRSRTLRESTKSLMQGLLEDDEQSRSAILNLEDTFLGTIESDELDIYTCMALSSGRYGTCSKATLKIVPVAIIALMLQVLVPLLMLTHTISVLGGNNDSFVQPANCYPNFRYAGAIIYYYSIYHMFGDSKDDSRTLVLDLSDAYPLRWAYVWPAILGEFLNIFVGFVLVVTLIFNFLNQSDPADLVINAMSLNFLGSIDNEFVSDTTKEEAKENFCYVVEHGSHIRLQVKNKRLLGQFLAITGNFFYFLRALLVVGVGVFLSIIFVTCEEGWLVAHLCQLPFLHETCGHRADQL